MSKNICSFFLFDLPKGFNLKSLINESVYKEYKDFSRLLAEELNTDPAARFEMFPSTTGLSSNVCFLQDILRLKFEISLGGGDADFSEEEMFLFSGEETVIVGMV